MCYYTATPKVVKIKRESTKPPFLSKVLHQQSNLFPRSVLISGFHSARCYGCQSLHENQQNLNHGAYPRHKARPDEFTPIFGGKIEDSEERRLSS